MVNSSANYWIAANALSISLNALGDANRVQCGLATGSVIMCYIKGVEGLEYDNGHNYRRWPLTISPTYFNTFTHKYVYVAIPRNPSVGNVAQVVFPSQKIDIYGYVVDDDSSDDSGDDSGTQQQIGNDNYYYIWLQGIISSSGEQGTEQRYFVQPCESGTLSTDEATSTEDTPWYNWNAIVQQVTFIKDIIMEATSRFLNLRVGTGNRAGNLTGVAKAGVTAENSEEDIVTPAYVKSVSSNRYLRKDIEDIANENITFKKGAKIGNFNSGLLGTGACIDKDGNAEVESLFSRSFISTPEFRFNRISVTEGEEWCTNGYGTIESVKIGEDENGHTVQNGGLITLHLEENDYASVAVGDICRGIFNDIVGAYQTETTDDDKDIAAGTSVKEGSGMGFPAKTGFFTSYFYIVRMVKNEKGNCQFIYGLRKETTPHPCAFMKFAQYGSFTDSTRRASSYTSSVNHAYEMRLQGVSTWQIATANIVTREGWLGDLTIEMRDGSTRTLQGYGLYVQDNVYFGNAVIQLDPYTIEMLERDMANYDVSISGHVSAVQVDNHGYIVGGIYTETGSGGNTNREYRIHSAINVRRGGTLLTEAASDEAAGTGTFKINYTTVGCTCMIENSTVYLTHIDNLLNTEDADPSSIDPDAMKAMESCKVELVIDCEGRTSITKTILVAINHDGQDGKGVEYIFINKDNWDGTEADKPTIYDDPAERQQDDYRPYTDDQQTDRWTDEPSGVGNNNKYEFYAQRKQINGIWQPFGAVKLWNTYVVDGVTPYVMDLSNEQSQVNCNENGEPVGGYETSKLMIFKGTSYAFTDFSTITITPQNIKCNGNSSAFTLTTAQKQAAQQAGYFELVPSNIGSSSNAAEITVTAVYGNITLIATYKINKNIAGKNGVIYSLLPSLDTIRKNKSGSLVDDTLTLQVKKTVGATATILSTAQQLSDEGLSLTYENASGSGTISGVSISTSTLVGNSGSGTWGKVYLKKSNVVVDAERLNVVTDGQDGDDGDDGFYYQKQYSRSSSRTSYSTTESDWSATSPTPTGEKPYIWERSRLYNPNTQTAGSWTYTCLTGFDGVKGDTGRMYYPVGEYSNQTQYTVTDDLCPVVYSSSNESYYYAVQSSYGQSLSDTRYWKVFSNFEAIFVNILFANSARLGAFVIYGNRFISQKGTLNGVESTNYSNSNFIPYLEMNAAEGTIVAKRGSVGGFSIGDTSIGLSSITGDERGYTYIERDGYISIYNKPASSRTYALSVNGGAEILGDTNHKVNIRNNNNEVNINSISLGINSDAPNASVCTIGNSQSTVDIKSETDFYENIEFKKEALFNGNVAMPNVIISSSTQNPSFPSSPKVGQFVFAKGTTGSLTISIPNGYKVMNQNDTGVTTGSITIGTLSTIFMYFGSNTWVRFYCG